MVIKIYNFPPPSSGDALPSVPFNLSLEERRKGRSLFLSWQVPPQVPQGTSLLPPQGRQLQDIVVFVLERRNTTNIRPIWPDDKGWALVTFVSLGFIKIEEAVISYNLVNELKSWPMFYKCANHINISNVAIYVCRFFKYRIIIFQLLM